MKLTLKKQALLTGGFTFLLSLSVHAINPQINPLMNCDFQNVGPQIAPGAPGVDQHWAPARKDAVGTSYEADSQTISQSPLWFTLAEGILSEVFYPYNDQVQIGDFQFLITDGVKFFSEQRKDTVSTVDFIDDGMAVRVRGHDLTGAYEFEQLYVTDTQSATLKIKTKLKFLRPGLKLYLLLNPALNNGRESIGFASTAGLFATQATPMRRAANGKTTVSLALMTSAKIIRASTGYVGCSDGWQDISRHYRLTNIFPQAGPGNIALTAQLDTSQVIQDFEYDVSIAFGSSLPEAQTFAQAAQTETFQDTQKRYESGWKSYLQSLDQSRLGGQPFFKTNIDARRSAQIIKMHEDKTFKGAIVASLSKPGIPAGERSPGNNMGGYHLIWPRDLYHAAMALIASGDTKTPLSTLNYLTLSQKQNGSWSQNFWLDALPFWEGLQMDEVAFPILLAHQIQKQGLKILSPRDLEMVRKAANFIANFGPYTPQDRWEEANGYIPSTIAVQIAALEAASVLISDSRLTSIADHWRKNVDRWTLVTDSPLGKNYYLRTSPSGFPGNSDRYEIANGGAQVFAWQVIDGGFLELVKYGIKPPFDQGILSTLAIYERQNPNKGYRRYNGDQYGPDYKGGYWPLLAAERGLYAVAAGDLNRARSQSQVVLQSATSAGLFPEQNETLGIPTQIGKGGACPLVWSHANFILLERSIQDGQVFETP
jgi:glucoamylase